MSQNHQTPLVALESLSADFIIPLPQAGMIKVSGEQRNDYLHSQLTIDLKEFPEGKARLCAHCDSKGKTWSVMQVCRFKDSVLMSLASSALPASLGELQKYGVFSKVTIEDASSEFTQYAGRGEKVSAFIQSQFNGVPTAHGQVIENATGFVSCSDFSPDLYKICLTDNGLNAWEQFKAQEEIVSYSPEVYDAIAVKNGIPSVTDDNIGQFIPQMINLQALDAIDFKKGCYMGQEVIARTRYLGKNKRAAMIFKLDGDHAVKPADTIDLQLGENWRKGGVIIRCASLPKETWLLAVVANDTEQSATFRLTDKPDVTFSPIKLPYAIADDSDKLVKRQ